LADKADLAEDKVALWLDANNGTLPTIKQAKTIAKALKLPFAGLYMFSGRLPPGKFLVSLRSGIRWN
jgi:hypothetical protein